MTTQPAPESYRLGAILQFLARHWDIHYDRGAISLAIRLGPAETLDALDRLIEWGLVDARQATIGVRVFGLAPAANVSRTAAQLALVANADRTAGQAAAECLAGAGWRAVAVAEIAKAGFILDRVRPAFAVIDGLADGDRIDWDRLAGLNLAGNRVPALLWTGRAEIDATLAGQHGFAGILRKPLDCADLIDQARRIADAALTR